LNEMTLKVITKQVISAFIEMKAKLVVHRDIHPKNIMCDKNGLQLKIIDFGVARKKADAKAMLYS